MTQYLNMGDDNATQRAARVLEVPSPMAMTTTPIQLEQISTDAVMKASIDLAERGAKTKYPVLITGETGTGKDVMASAIHYAGKHRNSPFVAVNCGAMPPTLLVDLLFGHAAGAFTGAHKKSDGYFHMADRGTIFLDEIGELPLDGQKSLLRVLQDGMVTRLGSSTTDKVDVRVITATNRDLRVDVKNGAFREDLYYRLAAINLSMAPLRARPLDMLRLSKHFLQIAAKEQNKTIDGFDDNARAALHAYAWPGNVRELIQVVTIATLMCDDNRVSLQNIRDAAPHILHPNMVVSLPPAAAPYVTPAPAAPSVGAPDAAGKWLRIDNGNGGFVSLAAVERQIIETALETHKGVKERVAGEIGMSQKTLYNRLKEYQVADAAQGGAPTLPAVITRGGTDKPQP